MKTEAIITNKSFEIVGYELMAHIALTVLLLTSIVCGMNVMQERMVLMDRKETVSKANGVVLHSDGELLSAVDFSLEPIENEFKAEILENPLEMIKPEAILKTEETVMSQSDIKQEIEIMPEKVEPALSYNGSLDTVYCAGSTIDLNGLEIVLDEKIIPLEECVIEGVDTTVAGKFSVKITYGEYYVEIPYTVEDYTVILHGAGEERTCSLVNYELDINAVGTPARLGKVFTGWYRDEACTVPFVTALPGEVMLDLYAGWSDFDKYVCDDAGYITGYTGFFGSITDGLLNLPAHPSCVGVRANAFAALEEFVTDIYIPANITQIENGAFDSLPYVFYIYVHPDNPVYSSENGILYTKDMSSVVAYPSGR